LKNGEWVETTTHSQGNTYYHDSLRTLALLLIGNLMTRP
jgi:hypothetical protein